MLTPKLLASQGVTDSSIVEEIALLRELDPYGCYLRPG
jgi:hypothetical protein